MKNLAIVLGVAAVAVLAGCKDPKYVTKKGRAQNEVKTAVTEPVVTPDVKPVSSKPVMAVTAKPGSVSDVEIEVIDGTVEPTPVAKPSKPAPKATSAATATKDAVAATAATPETTTYIVQRGDLLSTISKKYNITQKAILAANPGLDANKIRIGQKIKLPGKVDVGEQTVPAGAFAKPAPKVYVPYTGATKDYTVVNGDYLGKIAQANGLSVRQLKELNGLSSDKLRVKQVLKVPAVAPAKTAVAAAVAPKSLAVKPLDAPVAVKPVAKPVEKTSEPAVEPVAVAPAVETAAAAASAPAPEAGAGVVYEVQDGEDITGLSIRFSMDPAEIRSLNNMSEEDEVKAGQRIRLPADAL